MSINVHVIMVRDGDMNSYGIHSIKLVSEDHMKWVRKEWSMDGGEDITPSQEEEVKQYCDDNGIEYCLDINGKLEVNGDDDAGIIVPAIEECKNLKEFAVIMKAKDYNILTENEVLVY